MFGSASTSSKAAGASARYFSVPRFLAIAMRAARRDALAVELAQNVQIIGVPPNTAEAVFQHGTSVHSASASVSPCLFVLRIA